MKIWLIPLIGLTLALAAACTSEGDPPTPTVDADVSGVLAGQVIIGPLCPIEPCGDSYGDIYSGRELVLQQPGGVLLQIPLQSDGTFEAAIPTGTYSANLDRCEYLGCPRTFPVSVEIRDGETSTLDIDIDTGVRSPVGASEAHQLSENLRAAGVSVEAGGPISQVFFSVPGQVLTIDGTDVQVYEYPRPEDADLDAAQVSLDGRTVGSTSIMWATTPHFYMQETLIVLYVGDDAALQMLLEETLGPQFAGGGQATVGPTPSEVSQAEEAFRNLLTVEDVYTPLTTGVRLNTDFTDFKAMAERVDPAQVVNIDSWYGLGIDATSGDTSMTFSVVDFDSPSSALAHFNIVKSDTPGMQDMPQPIGDASIQVEFNAQGIGGVLVFIQGDKVIQLHTSQPEGEEPLLSLEGLEELAELVAGRL